MPLCVRALHASVWSQGAYTRRQGWARRNRLFLACMLDSGWRYWQCLVVASGSGVLPRRAMVGARDAVGGEAVARGSDGGMHIPVGRERPAVAEVFLALVRRAFANEYAVFCVDRCAQVRHASDASDAGDDANTNVHSLMNGWTQARVTHCALVLGVAGVTRALVSAPPPRDVVLG